jgi:hypothetical protein
MRLEIEKALHDALEGERVKASTIAKQFTVGTIHNEYWVSRSEALESAKDIVSKELGRFFNAIDCTGKGAP